MTNRSVLLKKILKKRQLLIVLILVVGFLWSWLPFVEVAQLADPPILGRLIAFLVYGLLSAACIAIFYYTIRGLKRYYFRKNRVSAAFLVAVFLIWSAVEFFAAWVVAVVWFGNGSSFDTVLPFASLTPFLMYTPLGFLARFVGFHGVSAAFVTIVTACVMKKTRRFALPAIGIVLAAALLSWGLYKKPDGKPFTAQIVAEHLQERISDKNSAADLVVFPEYGLDDIDAGTVSERLTSPPGKKEVFFVGSKQHQKETGIENLLVFGSTEQGFISTIPKSRLIPGGEYLPYAVEVPLRIFQADQTLYNFTFTREIVKGSEPLQPFAMHDGAVIGVEVCASIISPGDYRALTQQGATVLANAASLEIFRSPVFDMQHEGLARFMAIANARPFLQSANSGTAFAIDHNGHVLSRIDPVDKSLVTVTTNQKTTPYTLLGEWPAYLGGILLLVVLVKRLQKRRGLLAVGTRRTKS